MSMPQFSEQLTVQLCSLRQIPKSHAMAVLTFTFSKFSNENWFHQDQLWLEGFHVFPTMSMPTKDEHAALIGLPDWGRRVVSLTKHSVVDNLLYGKDLDDSGDDPHRDFMRNMLENGYAGEPSGHRDAKQANKKLRAVLNVTSQMSHHIDDMSPHEAFMTKFADRAGARTTENRFKPLRAPGLAHTQSMSDIMGRPDFARTPRGIRVKEVNAAGGKTDPELQRTQGRACVISTKWTRSTLRLGDTEHPGALLDEGPDERFDGHAGQARKQVKAAKVGCSLKSVSVVDKLLYGRDLSGAETDPAVEYAQKFAGYAGSVWKIPKKQPQEAPGESLISARQVPKTPSVASARTEPSVADGAEGKSSVLGNSVSFQTTGQPESNQTNQTDTMPKDELKAAAPDATCEADGTLMPDAKTALPQDLAQSPPSSAPQTPTRQTQRSLRSPFAVARSSPPSSTGSRTPSVSGRPRWQWGKMFQWNVSTYGFVSKWGIPKSSQKVPSGWRTWLT